VIGKSSAQGTSPAQATLPQRTQAAGPDLPERRPRPEAIPQPWWVMRRCRPRAAGCRPWPTASARTRFPGSSDAGCGATPRPRRARRLCMSRSTPRVESGGDERAAAVQRFPATGIEAPRVPPGPGPGRGRRRPGRRPARSDEISRFAVAGGTQDSVQCAGGRGTLRSARSAPSVSGPAQASPANHIGGFACLPTCGCHHGLRPSADGGWADSGQPALARRR
jgi:hypothetical protein